MSNVVLKERQWLKRLKNYYNRQQEPGPSLKKYSSEYFAPFYARGYKETAVCNSCWTFYHPGELDPYFPERHQVKGSFGNKECLNAYTAGGTFPAKINIGGNFVEIPCPADHCSWVISTTNRLRRPLTLENHPGCNNRGDIITLHKHYLKFFNGA